MKFTSIIILLTMGSLLFGTAAQAQCALTNATIERNGVSSSNGNCIVNINLSFTIDKNGGNKFTYIHLWLPGTHPVPAIDYNKNGTKGPTASQLGNVLATLALDTDGDISLLSSYRPDPSNVTPLFAGLVLTEQSHNGITKVVIDNIQLTIPGACSSLPVLSGDVWSTQSDAMNSPAHCGTSNFDLSIGDPIVAGVINCNPPNGPRTFDLDVTTTSPTNLAIVYKVYLDDGALTGGVTTFGPGDNLIFTSGSIDISASSPLNIDGASYSYGTGQDARNLWVEVTRPNIAGSNAMLAELTNLCTPVPLPVKLVNLDGKSAEGGVLISWQTTEETGSSHFEIERGQTPDRFQKMGQVQSKGDGSALLSYSFFDVSPVRGVNYYRLKQVDRDGRFEYTRIISVKNDFTGKDFVLKGNPISGQNIVLMTPDSDYQSISLFDKSGVAIPVAVKRSANELSLATAGQLSAGVYILKIQRNHGVISKTVIVP